MSEHRFKTDSKKRQAILDYMNGKKLNFTRSTRGFEDFWNVFGLSDTEFQSLKSSVHNLKEEYNGITFKEFVEQNDKKSD